ncbi:MAG: hypothetical protein HQL65_04245, partial [Magnetococcales bacterium]|nr:hypothetical protein [Magnetococcales bacterium]
REEIQTRKETQEKFPEIGQESDEAFEVDLSDSGTSDSISFSTSETLEASVTVNAGLGEETGNALETIPFSFSGGLMGSVAGPIQKLESDPGQEKYSDDGDLDLGSLSEEAGVVRYEFEKSPDVTPPPVSSPEPEKKLNVNAWPSLTIGKNKQDTKVKVDAEEDDALDLRAISADLGLRSMDVPANPA